MSAENGPAARQQRPSLALPEAGPLFRGGALTSVATLLFVLALRVAGKGWLLWPVALVMLVVAAFTGWAAAIQLTGGERLDDHPWD